MKVKLLLLFSAIVITVNAQSDTSLTHKIGDQAPPLRVQQWVKGTPIVNFEKGKVYVLDFWATWCGPCRATMPHLSALARKYKKVTFSAIDVFERRNNETKSSAQIKAFVDSMGKKMNFNVAVEDTNVTVHDWFDAFNNERAIPTTFVIDGDGRVAWIGVPMELDTTLKKIITNNWDINGESVKKNVTDNKTKRLEKLDSIAASKLRGYQGKYNDLTDLGSPDSILMVIDKMVKQEPELKFAPWVAGYTFSALLKTDPHKAYEFGKQALTSSFGWSAYGTIISVIRDDLRKLSMPAQIYLLGAECYEIKINGSPNASIILRAKQYDELAEWYFKGGNKEKAIQTEKKKIKLWEKQLKGTTK